MACGKPAALLTPFMAYPCVLDEGHADECRPGGECIAHGKYVGQSNAAPQCPKWPECVTHAATMAINQFMQEYEGTVCAACQSEKWAQSPFCRACCIKLQRAHLMKALQAQMDYYGKDWRTWEPFVLKHFWTHYDVCRLYLIDVRRHHESDR